MAVIVVLMEDTNNCTCDLKSSGGKKKVGCLLRFRTRCLELHIAYLQISNNAGNCFYSFLEQYSIWNPVMDRVTLPRHLFACLLAVILGVAVERAEFVPWHC